MPTCIFTVIIIEHKYFVERKRQYHLQDTIDTILLEVIYWTLSKSILRQNVCNFPSGYAIDD